MGKLEDEGYLLTGLDLVIKTEVEGKLVDIEMDVYSKIFIVDGLPITGFFTIPTGESLVDLEPIEVDMINNFIWTYNVERIHVLKEGDIKIYEQKFKYTIFRNNKPFCHATFGDITTTERNLHSVLEKLHTKRSRVDFRMKDYKDRLVGKAFTVNNITFKVIDYIDGENKIKVLTGDNSETTLDAFIVNE